MYYTLSSMNINTVGGQIQDNHAEVAIYKDTKTSLEMIRDGIWLSTN